MAEIDAPSFLECLAPGELDDGIVETKVQDQSEVGAGRRRNRFTRTLKVFSFGRNITNAQKEALEAFYETTLDRGVEAFNWTHPYSDVAYEVVFPRRPSIKHLMRGYWRIEVELEEI